jgi:hypothetical protein
MIDWKILNSMPLSKYCKGSIVAARIYADVPGNKCQCGGVFSKRVPHPDEPLVKVPKCTGCDSPPPLYRIDADAFGLNGEKIRIYLRHDQNNSRLNKIAKVLFTIERIQQEIIDGSFDIRKYDSEESRLSFIFENYYLKAYLLKYEGDEKYQKWLALRIAESKEKKEVLNLANPEGEAPVYKMSPKGLKEKKGFIRREILPAFGKMDMTKINDAEVKRFKDKITDRPRSRHLAYAELRAVLTEAKLDGKITVLPHFDRIPRAAKRTNTMTHKVAKTTISGLVNEVYKFAFELFTSYILRQCEVCALKWTKVDMVKEQFTVDCHFSDGVLIGGRKSVSEGESASMTYEMTPKIKKLFEEHHPTNKALVPINWENDFVFLNQYGDHISVGSMWEMWKILRESAGHEHQAYECKHATTGEFAKKYNGNMFKLKAAGGWTNTATVERYVDEKVEMVGLD